jgi:AbrB family looped-hinge helix DNA binding protein
MKATVTNKGQVTIPKPLRERMGITPGTTLDFCEENGRLVVQKTPATDPVTPVLGCLMLDKATDAILADLRDPT